MKEKLRLTGPVVVLAALAAIAFCLLKYESEYLWKVQELNLFLDTPLFLKQQMVTSGWLLTWLGTYFTEFFYHQWMGVGLLCLWWVVMMAVIGRTFRVPLKWAAVLLIPVVAILLSNVELGYWIYYLKLRGHFFAATIGTTIAVAAVWLFRLIPGKFNLRPVFVVLSVAALYPLIGFYGLVAAGLMAILSWRLKDMTLTSRLVTTGAALIAIGFWPLFYYNYVFYQTSTNNIYVTGLPLFVLDKEYANYYIPYYILVASLVAMAVLYKPVRQKAVSRPLIWGGLQVVLIAALIYGTYTYWYKDFNFHKELRMMQCVEALDWNGVLAEAAVESDEPTRAIVMMKNLALFRLGRQGDEMYRFKTGAKASDTPIMLRMAQVAGRSIYYHYGQTNFCYRWCLEDGVEEGWRAEYLKYLVRCSLVNGEDRLARKYIDLLKHTRYHKAWAEQYERFVGHRSAVLTNAEFKPILHLTRTDDVLSSDNSLVEYFLMYQFIQQGSDDKLYHEQALISALWSKDIQIFWPRFFQYAKSHPGQHMPTHFQEAAYLYGHLEHQIDVSKMPFDKDVVKNYEDFMAEAQRCAGMSDEQMRQMLYPRFGHTFYYEYFLIRNQKLY